MTDYQPLLARAIGALDPNTGEGRRAIYDRARQALLNQLRAANPPLADAEITRERLALEEAIRKAETQAAQANPHTVRAPSAAQPSQVRGPMAPASAPRASAPVTSEAPVLRSLAPPAAPRTPVETRPLPASAPASRDRAAVPANGGRQMRERAAPGYPQNENVRPPRQAQPEAYDDPLLEPEPDLDRIPESGPSSRDELEPNRLPEPNRLTQRRRPLATRGVQPEISPEEFVPGASQRPPRGPGAGLARDVPKKSGRAKILIVGLIVLLTAVAGLLGYANRGRVLALLGIDRSASSPGDDRPKSGERLTSSQSSQQRAPSAPSPSVDPAVAQRAVLYEENPGGGQQFQNFVGTAVWRTETVTLGAGRAPDLGLRVNIEIPDRKISITMSLRRNADASFPASHTIEVQFNSPGDPFGGVSDMRGVRAKSSETAQGTPIAAAVEKVKEGFFLLALPNTEEEANLTMLRERDWLDIPFVYNNGRRAVLTFQKGTPGERAMNDSLAAWGKGG